MREKKNIRKKESGRIRGSKEHKRPKLKEHKHPKLPIPPPKTKMSPKIKEMPKHQEAKQEKGEIQLSRVPLQKQVSSKSNPTAVKAKPPICKPSRDIRKDSNIAKTSECKEIPKINPNLSNDPPSELSQQDTPVIENSVINEAKEIINITTSSPITIVFNGYTFKVDFHSLQIYSNELPVEETVILLKKWLNKCFDQLSLVEYSESGESRKGD